MMTFVSRHVSLTRLLPGGKLLGWRRDLMQDKAELSDQW